MRVFKATKAKVHDRGKAPDAFLDELIDVIAKLPESVFAANAFVDIYSYVRPELGPWTSIEHRRAVMCEVLRVLGGFESSWDWKCGHDTINPSENRDLTKSAGIFQVSADSMNFDNSLKSLTLKHAGTLNASTFRLAMMNDHPFAIEYTARLLRFTVKHHGPVKRKEINRYLSRDAVAEFQSFLATTTKPATDS